MKRIAITIPTLGLGGCEKALVSMLEHIDLNTYNVTLYVAEKDGYLQPYIPIDINIVYIDEAMMNIKELMLNYYSKKNYIMIVKSIYYWMLLRLCKDRTKELKYHVGMLSKISEEYDLAISYFMPPNLGDWYTLEKIKAKKKAIWIHGDIEHITDIHNKFHEDMYNRYNKIFCVSNQLVQVFEKTFPRCKGKVEVFHNIIDVGKVKKLAEEKESYADNFEGLKILTVGRLSEEKGQLIIPEILIKLKSIGLNVRWYCIGDGYLREKLKEKIILLGLENDLILLGPKDNVYTYMKNCDIYVQTSKNEGFCLTLAEAIIFNKPIVTTNFKGALDQIIDSISGYIVNYDAEEMYLKIRELVEKKEIRDLFQKNLREKSKNHKNEIKKIYDLIN